MTFKTIIKHLAALLINQNLKTNRKKNCKNVLKV